MLFATMYISLLKQRGLKGMCFPCVSFPSQLPCRSASSGANEDDDLLRRRQIGRGETLPPGSTPQLYWRKIALLGGGHTNKLQRSFQVTDDAPVSDPHCVCSRR